jgi:hypothetical protein
MFDLNQAIVRWRDILGEQPGVRTADLEELEDHLREAIAELQGQGLNQEEAFIIASRRLGNPEDLGSEFAIADPDSRRRFRLRWMVVGALALIFLWLASGFLLGLGAGTVHLVAGRSMVVPMVGGGMLIGLTRALLLVLGGVLIWKLLATDGSSRRLGAMGVGSIIAAALALAFLVLISRLGAGFLLGRTFTPDGLMLWHTANGWVNLILFLLLPSLLLVGLWKLIRR